MNAATPEAEGKDYLFDNAWEQARARLALLVSIYDPGSIRILETLPIGEGSRCLEVGAGIGSIVTWLAQRVGPSGHVVATDIDTRFLTSVEHPNLEVRKHDIVSDELESDAFDFVYTRLLLSHLPQRDLALARMIAALKPGGWLLVEDFDHATFFLDGRHDTEPPSPLAKVREAFFTLASRRGLAHAYGRTLPALLRANGLENIAVHAEVLIDNGGSPFARFHLMGASQLREGLIASGIAADELEAGLAQLQDPDTTVLSQIMVSVCGQRGT